MALDSATAQMDAVSQSNFEFSNALLEVSFYVNFLVGKSNGIFCNESLLVLECEIYHFE